ncbi:MAG TPA: GAF domain-containing protein, partial [Ktedonobacteraceae bacterium]
MTSKSSKSRRQESKILKEVASQISSTLDLQDILNSVLKAARGYLQGAFKGSIYLFNQRTQMLETKAYTSQDATFQQELSFALTGEKGIILRVFLSKHSVRVANVETDPLWSSLYISADPLHRMFSELDVPLLDGEEAIGVLNFTSTNPDTFTQADQDFMEALAGQSVLPIKNAQQHQAIIERRVTELTRLQEIERLINSTLNLEDILQAILKAASGYLQGAFKGSIYLYNERTQMLETQKYISADRTFRQSRSFALTEQKGIALWVFRNKRSVRVANVETDPVWRDLYVQADPQHRVLSELYVPLLDREEAIGVINFANTQPDTFTEADQEFLETLAEHVVLAIKNGRLHQAVVQRRLTELTKLREIDRQINSTLELQDILETILQAASEQLPKAHLGAILLYNERTQMLETEKHISKDPLLQPNRHVEVRGNALKGITREVFSSKSTLRIGNIKKDPRWRKLYIPPT